MAKKIRQDLEKIYGPEYAVLLNIMGDLREAVMAAGRSSDDNRRLFENLLQSPILEAIRHEQWDCVQWIIRDLTGVDMNLPEKG